jgi:hypothetical protein
MSIMSLINLKADFESLKAKPEVVAFVDFVKTKIISYVSSEIIKVGAEKKAAVVKEVVEYITTHFVTKNTILAYLINLLVEYVPELVQVIYNYLATSIAGLTK